MMYCGYNICIKTIRVNVVRQTEWVWTLAFMFGTLSSDGESDFAVQRDAYGRETSVVNGNASYAYALDRCGFATNGTATIGGVSRTIFRGVDDQGRLVSFGMDGGYASQTINYRADGRIGSISNVDAVVTYSYSEDGYDLGYSLALVGGTVFTRTLSRDPHRRELVLNVANSAGGNFAYSYDALSRPATRNDDSFDYNFRSEVIGATISGNHEEHSYDNIGNSVFAAYNYVTNTYTANNLNQYTAVNRTIEQSEQSNNLAYDADGNLLSCGQWAYTYDSASRLVSVTSNGVLLVTNFYDARGRRVKKVTQTGTFTFFYDDWNLVEERAAYTNGTVSTLHYYWGKDVSGTQQGAGGVGGLLYLTIDGTIYIPCYDNNGNVMRYIEVSGNVVAQYTYDAFGRTISQSGPLADVFRHRFSTKYFDVETGLYYYGCRFYSTFLRRWLTRDPIGEAGGLNLCVFVLNDPVGSFDAIGYRRTSLLGIVMDGWCEDAYRYAMNKMQTSEERRAWDRYTNHGWSGRDRDIELSSSEVRFVAESIKSVVSYVENQRRSCRCGIDFSVSKSIGGAAPSPWVKALGGVSVNVTTTCSGGCFSYEYQINDLYDFDIKGIPGFTSRTPEGEAATIGINLAQTCLLCDWQTFYHKGVYFSK